jgi:hypothetical protein
MSDVYPKQSWRPRDSRRSAWRENRYRERRKKPRGERKLLRRLN